jgi:hypothetical protein
VLTLDDLPPGFRVTSHAPVALSDADKRAFAQCLNSATSVFDGPSGSTKVSSQDFADDTNEIANDVVLAPKKSAIDPGFAQLTKPASLGCLKQLYVSRLGGEGVQADPATVSVARFTIPGVADRTVGVELSASVPSEKGRATDYLDVLVAQRKRAVVTLIAEGSGHPYDRANEIELLGDVFERLRSQVN